MVTTTSYGTWNNYGDRSNSTVEATIADFINGGDDDWRERVETSGALEKMAADYRAEINKALPDSVSLCGNEFIGPYYATDYDWDGDLNISEIIASVDLDAIVERHAPDLN